MSEVGETAEHGPGTVRGGRLPPWLRTSFRGARERRKVRALLRKLNLHTVCESALCPNLCECWARRSATLMVMGNVCTRNCRFCGVQHGRPEPLDTEEPANAARAVEALDLRYVVLTCVTRDDLPDGGAGHIAETVRCIRARCPDTRIEVLVSDLGGNPSAIDTVLDADPDVFNHNIETTPRLSRAIRDHANYRRSLAVLARAAAAAEAVHWSPLIKSGFMLGLGESDGEVRGMLADLREAKVQIVTIGQYLPPSGDHWPIARYVPPEEFERWALVGKEQYGFLEVLSAPLVRSSYRAEETAESCRRALDAGDSQE